MSQDCKIVIRFPELSGLEAGRAAQQLKQLIQDKKDQKDPESLSIELQRGKAGSQNLGDVLIVILTSGAVTALAAGVRAFIAARGSKVVIETEDGKVIAYGDAARNIDTAQTVEKLTKARSHESPAKSEAKREVAVPLKAAPKELAASAVSTKPGVGRKKASKPAALAGATRKKDK